MRISWLAPREFFLQMTSHKTGRQHIAGGLQLKAGGWREIALSHAVSLLDIGGDFQ